MRIISKKRDYYDTALGYGIEKDRIFNRKFEEIRFSNFLGKNEYENIFKDFLSLNNLNTFMFRVPDFFDFKIINVKRNILFFCGEYHPYLKIKIENKNKISELFFYKFGDLEDFLKDSLRKGNQKEFEEYWNRNSKRFIAFNKKSIVDFFNIKIKNCIDFFHILNASYFSISYNLSITGRVSQYEIDIYPTLIDIGFQKIKNPYECFQDISQFLFGVLGTKENETIEIEDKYKIESHGYDIKKSFRKRK